MYFSNKIIARIVCFMITTILLSVHRSMYGNKEHYLPFIINGQNAYCADLGHVIWDVFPSAWLRKASV